MTPLCDLCDNEALPYSALCNECAWDLMYPEDEMPPEDQW